MSKHERKRIGLRGWLVIGGSGLLTAIILLLVGLLYTETGLRWLIDQAQQRAPGELRVEQVRGSLAGPLELEGLHYRNDDLDIQLERLSLRWRPVLLLLGSIQIQQLDLEALTLRLPPPAEAAEGDPFELPEAIHLPLRVNLQALNLNDFQLIRGEESLLELEQGFLDALAVGDHVRIDRLHISDPRLALEGDGEITLSGDWPLTLDADWTLRWPELPVIAGHSRVEGDRHRLGLEQVLDQPFRLQAEGAVRAPLEAPRVTLAVRFRDLRPSTLVEEAPAGRLSGQLDIEGDPATLQVQGHVDASDTPWGDFGLRGDVRLPTDLAWLELEAVSLRQATGPLRLDAEGRIDAPTGDNPLLDLHLSWVELVWPLDSAPLLSSRSGQLALNGGLDDWQLALSAQLAWHGEEAPVAGPLRGQLDGELTGGREAADIEALKLAMDGGPTLDFSGQAGWADGAESLDGHFRIQALDPARLLPDWPGQLAAEGDIRLNREAGEWHGSLDLDRLEGELVGRAVSGQGGLQYGGKRLGFDGLNLRFGESTLQADGVIAQEGDSAIRFQLALADLAQWPLQAAGTLRTSGQISGRPDALDLDLTADTEGLRYQALSVDTARLSLRLDDSGHQDSEFELLAEGIDYADQPLSRLHIEGNGRRDSHRISLIAEQTLVSFGVSVAGGLSEALDWSGELVDMRLHNEAVGQWQQRQPTALSVGPSGGQLAQTCLDALDHAGRLCFSGRGDEQGHWRVQVDGEGFPLALFVDQAATGVEVSGDIGLSLRAEDQGEGLNASGHLNFSPGKISQQLDGQSVDLIAIDGGQGQFSWTPTESKGELGLDLSDGGSLQAWAELPRGMDGPLEGRLDADIPQLGLLPLLVAEIGRAEGRLRLAVDIDGRLDEPRLSGDVRVQDAELVLPDLGITTEAVDIHLRGDMSSLTLNASARSGGGDIAFEADLDRVDGGEWLGGATLSGERFLVFNTPDARVRINPALELTVRPDRRLDIGGELHVPWARITPRDLRSSVQVSSDEVVVGEVLREASDQSRWRIYSRVRTSLGEDVHFEGYGLTGHIVGAVDIRDEPGALTRATGELEVREGEYEAWRQRLEVERGRLFYTDTPISDPALDIRAVRRPRNVVVGVNIRGTLRQPEVELFSEPPMQQSEQLSYLLTGQPLTEGGEGDRDLVREASLALQIAGGSYVGRRLGDRLGVDSVTIEAGENPEDTAVFFGEYLSPRLFISYGIGLFEGANVFRIRYEISSRWFLEAQTGPRSGADFIYSLERG